MPESLAKVRLSYQPAHPPLEGLECVEGVATVSIGHHAKIQELFPKTYGQPLIHLKKGVEKSHAPLRVGVVLSGGQAPGGHNVITGLFDALREMNPKCRLFGFLGGPAGVVEDEHKELTESLLAPYRNTGGFDLLGSGRTKIETAEQLEAARKNVEALKLDGLVIIGGDDSNTNAAFLAEYFLTHHCTTHVIGVPKTIDGDLKNGAIEVPFGFDTACKTYAHMIGNIARDALSAKKYTHFIKLMGRSASHITLECALQTHPNVAIIGEEVAARAMTLQQITDHLVSVIEKRAALGKNYGVILIPEGLIEFVPEMRRLIKELNALVEKGVIDVPSHLSREASETFAFLPEMIAHQLLMDRDPHGNVQVSHISTEQLLIHKVRERVNGKFTPVNHFFGYEGRAGFPSNFDANYCYALGFTAAALVDAGVTGYIAALQNLAEPASAWQPVGFPITMLLTLEERKGKEKAVIEKALVNLEGAPFQHFASKRDEWSLEDHYRYPGPIQLFGPQELCDQTTLTLQLESSHQINC